MPVDRLAFTAADLRGAVRLGIDATLGVTDLVEAMHAAIAERAPPVGAARSTRTSRLTGFVYRRVRGTTRVVGSALDAALGLLPDTGPRPARSPTREAFVAALNGVLGDRLAATGNPLAIPTTLRADPAAPGAAPRSCRRVLVLVHGLCMNDLQWRRNGHDHGERLARDAGWTVLRLHYDSGRSVAEIGGELAARLESLAGPAGAPDEIALVGHSMGGLVARAAVRAG
ncbi:MAG: alpha/beta hydrolase, partial [Burkholderiales bacterium]